MTTSPSAQAHFKAQVRAMLELIDGRGRGDDLDRVVSYSQQPRADVSRLTALFWVVDQEYHGPLRELIAAHRAQAGEVDDDAIYDLMLEVWREARGR